MWGLLLGGCADTGADRPETYIVRPEDTLYSIAWRHDLDYRDLARWNNIGADDFPVLVPQRPNQRFAQMTTAACNQDLHTRTT